MAYFLSVQHKRFSSCLQCVYNWYCALIRTSAITKMGRVADNKRGCENIPDKSQALNI